MIEKKIKNIELVTIALYEIGGARKFIDTEDIAVKADNIDSLNDLFNELNIVSLKNLYIEDKPNKENNLLTLFDLPKIPVKFNLDDSEVNYRNDCCCCF